MVAESLMRAPPDAILVAYRDDQACGHWIVVARRGSVRGALRRLHWMDPGGQASPRKLLLGWLSEGAQPSSTAQELIALHRPPRRAPAELRSRDSPAHQATVSTAEGDENSVTRSLEQLCQLRECGGAPEIPDSTGGTSSTQKPTRAGPA